MVPAATLRSCVALPSFLLAAAAAAQTDAPEKGAPYPVRAIRLVVPYAPGGNGDVVSRTHAINMSLYAKPGYDLLTDFAPISLVSSTPLVLMVHPSALDHMRSNRVRALGISSAQRSTLVPGLPTIAESALPGFEAIIWQGVLAPAGTPAGIVERLNREVAAALASAELKKQFVAAGVIPMPSTPAEFHGYIKAEIAKWGKVVKASGAKVD